jgi:tetratricopeptide (TPR) repeat protein
METLYYAVNGTGAVMDDPARSRSFLDECLDLARKLQNRSFIVFVLIYDATFMHHDPDEAMEMAQSAYVVARVLGNRRALAYAFKGLAAVCKSRGDDTSAAAYTQGWLRLSRELGDGFWIAYALGSLAELANRQGDLETARQYARESMQIYHDTGLGAAAAKPTYHLGWNAYLAGDYAEAAARLEESLVIGRALNLKIVFLRPMVDLGRVAIAQGDPARARAYFSEAFESITPHDMDARASWLEGICSLPDLVPERAARLLGGLDAYRASEQFPIPPSERAGHEALVEQVRAALGDGGFSAAWAAGNAMTVEETVECAAQCLQAQGG